MKISTGTHPTPWLHFEAETNEEAQYLHKFFTEDCKTIAKKFPLKDKTWTGPWSFREEKVVEEQPK